MPPLDHLDKWYLCPLCWVVSFPWVQATQPSPPAYGPSWASFHLRPIYELPFWKDIQGSTQPSGVTAPHSNDVNACNSTDVSTFIFKKQWQLQCSQITAFSALPYLSVHTCKSTETLTSIFNRAHSFLSNKMSGCDLPYFTSAILPLFRPCFCQEMLDQMILEVPSNLVFYYPMILWNKFSFW